MQQKILQGEFEKKNGIYYVYDPFSRPLGEGGMGIVYKGFRVNAATGGRQVVAIKAMRDTLPDEVYGRARREASVQLKNDNLVEMMGFISTDEQELGGRIIRRFYVVSEFLNGVVLTDLLKGNFKDCDGIEIPFAKDLYTKYISDRETTAVYIIKKVLAGIMALHDKGYIHRDIDPSNVMVTKDGNLKMIDFGIAKDVTHLNTHDGLRTADGVFIGKPEYAAPELVLGDVHSQNFSTDIYAIGILFYQLLVGKLPFEGAQYDVLQKQLKKNVPAGDIPYPKYRNIVRKATAKAKSARYQSCVEMRMAIDNAKSMIDWSKIGKIAAAAVVVAGIAFGAHTLFNSQRVIDPDPEPDYKLYQKALSKLDSNDSKSVEEGWKLMNELAAKNYDPAKCEVGATLFTDTKVKVELSPQITNRRRFLSLPENVDAAESKKMLESVTDQSSMSGEQLFALGLMCYRESEWQQAEALFNKAMKKLDTADELYDTTNEYLKKLREAVNTEVNQ